MRWQDIEWQQAKKMVKEMQVDLARAERAGDTRSVIRLQDRLAHSQAAKWLAVRRVTTTGGKHTPGLDRDVWRTPEQKWRAAQQLDARHCAPQPARRVYIPKGDGKERPLGILTMRDRALQALYWFALDPIAEVRADPHSYGFRQYRSTADAIGRCAEIFRARPMPAWVLEADIEACFDSISHQWLLEHIPLDFTVLRGWLRAGYMEHDRHYQPDCGLPQGGVISPTLANMALDGLERLLREHFHHSDRSRQRSQVEIVRYADDFIVTGANRSILAEEVQSILTQFLAARGMRFSATKTRITRLKQGFDFLGFHVQQPLFGSVRITPADKRFQRVLQTVRAVLETHPRATPTQIIARLTPILRGWTNYYDHVESRAAFDRMDDAVAAMLLQWATQRHPGWFQRKAISSYFAAVRGQPPCFTDGQGQRIWRAHEVILREHRPIEPACQPYDPRWNRYMAERQRGDDSAQEKSL